MSKKGYVYIVADGHGNVKIGESQNWKARIKQFGPMVRPIVVIASDDCRRLERQFHEKYADKRFVGEWFKLNLKEITELEMEENIVYGGHDDPEASYEVLVSNGFINPEETHG